MLTATYSLVAIRAEQGQSRSILVKLQQTVQGCVQRFHDTGLASVKSAFEKLGQFDNYLHTRKMALYVIPAVRGVTGEVDSLLQELEIMSARGLALFNIAQEKLQRLMARGESQLVEVCRSLKAYCDNLWQRLSKEENELLPLVSRLLTTEQWFPIAEKFLSDDRQMQHRRPGSDPGPKAICMS